jgi:predicted nucleic acid-binding protein
MVPDVIFVEVERHLGEISAKAHVPLETSRALLRELTKHVEVLPQALWASALPHAKELTRSAHASNDEPYVALALVQSAPVWSFDKALRQIPNLRIVSTAEVELLGAQG